MLAKKFLCSYYCIDMHQVVIELSYADCVLVPVDAGFFCGGYLSRVVEYLLFMDLLSPALCLDRSNTMFCSPVYPITY